MLKNKSKNMNKIKNNLFYLLPFLFLFNLQSTRAQFKIESNSKNFDLKSKYFEVAARDTFGLKDMVNIKGIVKLKYDNNSLYFKRNGLLNHSYGGNIDLNVIEFYYNQSKQNIKTEKFTTQDSPLGKIITNTSILNKDRMKEMGVALNYKDFFISFENAKKNNEVDGQTLIKVNEEKALTFFNFNFNNETSIFGAGFKYGFFKFIQNKKDGDKFKDYFAKLNYKGINLYYAKDFAGFFSFNLFDKINFDISYDKKIKINLATSDYSKLNKRKFERNLENRLRIVPRIYDSNLETSKNYLEDMFFTDLYSFSLNKDEINANLNFKNILFHYSKDSWKIGLRYKFLITTYDFYKKEAKLGLFFD